MLLMFKLVPKTAEVWFQHLLLLISLAVKYKSAFPVRRVANLDIMV